MAADHVRVQAGAGAIRLPAFRSQLDGITVGIGGESGPRTIQVNSPS